MDGGGFSGLQGFGVVLSFVLVRENLFGGGNSKVFHSCK